MSQIGQSRLGTSWYDSMTSLSSSLLLLLLLLLLSLLLLLLLPILLLLTFTVENNYSCYTKNR